MGNEHSHSEDAMVRKFWSIVESGNVPKMMKVIEQGGYQNLVNKEGLTPLMRSVQLRKYLISDLLVLSGAEVNAVSKSNPFVTSLYIASENNDAEAVKRLIKQGADPKILASVDDVKMSCFAIALQRNATLVVDALISHGADVNGTNCPHLPPPLAVAINNQNLDIVHKLLTRNADPNRVDLEFRTPLMHAVHLGLLDFAKMLVEEAKADLHARDKGGASALDLAIRHNRWDIAHYLWTAGAESSINRSAHGIIHGSWIRPYFVGEVPLPRYAAGFATMGRSLYLFGGITHQRPNDTENPADDSSQPEKTTLQDFWKLDLDQVTPVDMSGRFKKGNHHKNSLNSETAGPHIVVREHMISRKGIETSPASVIGKHSFHKKNGIAYFEIIVEALDADSSIGIGYGSNKIEKQDFPGWRPGSYGYHSDDAHAFGGSVRGHTWGRRFFVGDVVGAGIDFVSREVFFTLNGNFLGVAFSNIDGNEKYYPMLAVRGKTARMNVNFGERPFKFNFRVPALHWEQLAACPSHATLEAPHKLVTIDTQLVLIPRKGERGKKYFGYDTVAQEWHTYKSPSRISAFQGEDFGVMVSDNRIYCTDPEANDTKYPVISVDELVDGAYQRETVISGEPLDEADSKKVRGPSKSYYEMEANFPQLALSPTATPEEIKEAHSKRTKSILKTEFKSTPGFGWNDKLTFATKSALAVFDPQTCALKLSPSFGKGPPSEKASMLEFQGQVAAFGGWDGIRSRSELNFLDPATLQWYESHLSGVTPRERQSAHTAKTILPSDHHLFGFSLSHFLATQTHLSEALQASSATNETNSSSSSTVTRQQDVECLFLFGGVTGSEPTNDLEIYVPSPRLKSNLEYWKATEGSLYKICFVVSDPASESKTELVAEVSVLCARSSVMSNLVSTMNFEGETPRVKVKAMVQHFKALLQFLWDDRVQFPFHHLEARLFYDLVKQWAPEHADQVSQALLMNAPFNRSLWRTQMSELFRKPLFADVELDFRGKKVKAHKAVLMRNAHFKKLLEDNPGTTPDSPLAVIAIDCSKTLGKHLVKFVYTRHVDLEGTEDHLIELFTLSHTFGMSELKHQIEGILTYTMTSANVVAIMILAVQYEAVLTTQSCAAFISLNPSVIKTDEFRRNKELLEPHLLPIQNAPGSPSASRR